MTAPAASEVRAAGDAALLVEAGAGPPVPARLAAAIAAERVPGVTDIIPGARAVLVVTEPGRCDLGSLAGRLRLLARPGGPAGGAEADEVAGRTEAAGEVAEIPVRYDGPDLAEVAKLTGCTTDEVIARHSAAEYMVGWLGFSPGFAYLTGLDPVLHVPRLASPRTTVAAGSVAIAGPFTAVYPASSPGGWRLLGHTSARLWDPARQPPAALVPGMRVRFRPVSVLRPPSGTVPGDTVSPGGTAPSEGTVPGGTHPEGTVPPEGAVPGGTRPGDSTGSARSAGSSREGSHPGDADRVIEVIRPGPLATVQDPGRAGYGHLGVPRSGAADAASLRLANRLVGNPENAAAIEMTFGGAALLFRAAAWAAVTGAPAEIRIRPGRDARPDGGGQQDRLVRDRSGIGVPFAVPAGAMLAVSAPAAGLRSYLAVRGGIDVPPVLGSRSSDVLSGLGPAPLRPGDVLPLGSTSGCGPIVADVAPQPAIPPGPAELRIVAGPRDDWFAAGALDVLRTAGYEVTGASDRAGLRLSGPALPRERDGELPSEGMVTGALQVPPDGMPILFLADHPVTGGYPVIAVVISADIGRAAQLRPGDKVRFRLVRSPVA